MTQKYVNNLELDLAEDIVAGDTSFDVTDASSIPSLGPEDYVLLTIDNANGVEVMKCTGVSTNTLTVERAQEGTTAIAGTAGDTLAMFITAGTVQEAKLIGAPVKTVSTSTYTLLKEDSGYYIKFTNASGCAVTVPAQSSVDWLDGTIIRGRGTLGDVSFSGASVSTISGKSATADEGVEWTLKREGEDDWFLEGSLLDAAVLGTMSSATDTPFSTNTIAESTYGENLYVIGTNLANTQVATSSDGDTWTLRTHAMSSNGVTALAYGNGTFVAANGGQEASYSADGITWTLATTTDVDVAISGITYGNSTFVAVASSSRVYTSPDGVTWTTVSAFGVGVGNDFRDVVYGDSLFVGVGYSSPNAKIATSPDGTTWTNRTVSGSEILLSVAYGNGVYVAVGTSGAIKTSPDGISWTNETHGLGSGTFRDVSFGNGTFIVVGNGGVVGSSTDGSTWTDVTDTFSTSDVYTATYGDEVFVLGGASGKIAYIPLTTPTDTTAYYDDATANFTGDLQSSGASVITKESLIIPVTDETTAITSGTAKFTFRMPYAFTLSEVRASLTTAGSTSGTTTVDINEGGVSILSTALTIDAGEKTSTTAATAAVISDTALADDAEITIDVDAITSGATEAGLKVTLIGTSA